MGLLWTPKISRLSFSGVSDIFFCPWVGWTKCWHCLTLTRDITWLISDTSVFLVCISWCKCGYEPFPRTIWTLCLTVRWMVGKDEANITHPRCNKSTTNKLTLCVLLLFNNNHLMCLFFTLLCMVNVLSFGCCCDFCPLCILCYMVVTDSENKFAFGTIKAIYLETSNVEVP